MHQYTDMHSYVRLHAVYNVLYLVQTPMLIYRFYAEILNIFGDLATVQCFDLLIDFSTNTSTIFRWH